VADVAQPSLVQPPGHIGAIEIGGGSSLGHTEKQSAEQEQPLGSLGSIRHGHCRSGQRSLSERPVRRVLCWNLFFPDQGTCQLDGAAVLGDLFMVAGIPSTRGWIWCEFRVQQFLIPQCWCWLGFVWLPVAVDAQFSIDLRNLETLQAVQPFLDTKKS
jgi:hypothetical protein